MVLVSTKVLVDVIHDDQSQNHPSEEYDLVLECPLLDEPHDCVTESQHV